MTPEIKKMIAAKAAEVQQIKSDLENVTYLDDFNNEAASNSLTEIDNLLDDVIVILEQFED
ncbi:hypothetical protein EFA69_16060 [Rufibacter immobilis]|uniref:Uncharacterized protein n=1 Tax=Rufibacter immobilis TaxID=1348778 RepID=A0A3M9MQ61_9BACT|nr:hypothetical protein [Rufibacter immobilis]RNI27631.1 hypothetical protein EFA69_16060 [Rufibacter immobilis]